MTKEEFQNLEVGDLVISKIKGYRGWLGVGNVWRIYDLDNEHIWIDHGDFEHRPHAYSIRSFDVYYPDSIPREAK